MQHVLQNENNVIVFDTSNNKECNIVGSSTKSTTGGAKYVTGGACVLKRLSRKLPVQKKTPKKHKSSHF